MHLVVLLVALTYSGVSKGEVMQSTFEVSKVYNKRDHYMPEYDLLGGSPEENTSLDQSQEHWSHKVSLGLDYRIINFRGYEVYWNQEIVGFSTTEQYRRMYWDWELGQTFFKKFDIFWPHRS